MKLPVEVALVLTLNGWPDPAGPDGGRYICIMWDMLVDGPLGAARYQLRPILWC